VSRRDRCYFIATTSCTLDGESCTRPRWRLLKEGPDCVELAVPEPQAADLCYTACAQMNRQNRSGQTDLDSEMKLGTHDWSFRMNCWYLG
jgi:hypothetical protein